jgi:hypothetical protein
MITEAHQAIRECDTKGAATVPCSMPVATAQTVHAQAHLAGDPHGIMVRARCPR